MIQAERIRADIEALRAFTATPGSGVTRLSFSREEKQAREYLIKTMEKSGLEVCEHPSGCLIGCLNGENNNLSAVMTGSHYDTVRSGGAYDGICGVVAGLEVIRSFRDDNYIPQRPLKIVCFIEEEGTRFDVGMESSAALVGRLSLKDFEKIRDDDGVSYREAAEAQGIDMTGLDDSIIREKDLKAFIELHVEQGPVLEKQKKQIGIVDCITSMCFGGQVTICGRADHAGTTPMNMRLDAMRAAVNVINRFYENAGKIDKGLCATVGRLTLHPDSANVVPDRVVFSVDYRSQDEQLVGILKKLLLNDLEELKGKGFLCEYTDSGIAPAVKMNEDIMHILETEADKLGYSHMRLSSGAGHDTMNLAHICPVGMIFLPSKDGRSHCPEEYTNYEDIVRGTHVLEESIKYLCSE